MDTEIKYNPALINSLTSHLTNNSPIVIFGAGNLGRKMASFLINENKNVVAFSDNNKNIWGQQVNGVNVLAPTHVPADSVVIVSIWSPENSYAQAKKQLQDLGINEIYPAAAVMLLYREKLLPYYHFETSDYFLGSKAQQNEVLSMLADGESKKQYIAQLNCRVNLDFEGLPYPDTKNQYFPAGVVNLSDEEIFIDAGAYTGDTFLDFAQRVKSFKKYIALEPDPQNIEKLKKVIDESGNASKVEIFPFAVGAENCKLNFDATGGGGASISDSGSLEVDCKRIDDVFFDEAPTYLKFDIEGAELDALKGAKQTILTYKPKLAVCIYHLPNDLWEIPLFIKKEFPFYKLYLRTHQFDGLDFVLYAIA